jgi:murein DD-endopeptidase MepM/ murein hydrolase activator NlpD
MARDLAKRDTPSRSLPQRTFRRETTMPRQGTDLPELGVFASIRRPDMSGADQLSKILGLVNETGQKIAGDIQEGKDKEDAADALLDFSMDTKDDERFAKSRAYRDAWQVEGAKQLAIDVSTDVTERFNDRLNDPNDPPTIEDMDSLFEQALQEHLFDADGKPINLITPQAKVTLGNALAKLKQELMPKAAEAIATQQDERLFETTFRNRLFERKAGEPIGAPPAAPLDPLAPLPGPEVKAQTVQFGEPTGRLPVKGAVTNTMAQHIARGSTGVDLDGKIGDPVEAPAGGKVTVGRDKKSGLFVKIDHGGGVVSSYSHLSATDLKSGDVVPAGATLGKVGNSGNVSKKSGDGSHLHWRVKVDGKDVNPLAYNFKGGGSAEVQLHTGFEPQLASAPKEPYYVGAGFDFEGFMSTLPPSVNKGRAKAWVLQALAAEAADKGDPALLNGLEDSVRADGTPSLNPQEKLKVVELREQLENKVRIETDRKQKKLWDDNRDKVLEAFNAGNYPSRSWLSEQGRAGMLDDGFVFTAINHIEAEEERQQRELTAAQAAADKAAEEVVDMTVQSLIIRRQAGDLSGATYEADLSLLKSGKLGEGVEAMKRFGQLQSAARSGGEQARKSPQFAYFSTKLKNSYGPPKGGNGEFGTGSLLLKKPNGAIPEEQFDAMMAHYTSMVNQGKSPEEAYRSSVANYAPKAPQGRQAVRSRIAELRAKQRGN